MGTSPVTDSDDANLTAKNRSAVTQSVVISISSGPPSRKPSDASTDCAGGSKHPKRLALRGDGTAWLPSLRTLFVADLHLGKDASFRSAGVPVPSGGNEAMLESLTAAIKSLGVTDLVLLGDLVHDLNSWNADLSREWNDFRWRLSGVNVTLVLGNHDRSAQLPWSQLGINAVERSEIDGITAVHDVTDFKSVTESNSVTESYSDDPSAETSFRIGGHVHPVVTLNNSVDRLRLPCFIVEKRSVVLPAFGPFKGGFDCTPKRRRRSTRGRRTSESDEVRELYPICEGRIWRLRSDGQFA